MTSIQIIGHKNPDTDCTLSAIIMAEYLRNKGYSATPYIQGTLNKETEYLLEKYNISKPEIKTSLDTNIEVCLVDHNEASQAPENLGELDITWLVDHHKVRFETSSPLNMRVEPICSTASILYKMFRESGYEISEKTAIMMLACIMSDSLLWKSPTTTHEDKAIASQLQIIANIPDLEAFAMPMFEAKSDLGDMPVKDLIQYDYKNFQFGKYKIGVGTLETTNPGYGLGRKQEILIGMQELKQEQNLDFIMLSVVDILGEINTTIVGDGNDSHVIETVFGVNIKNNLAILGTRLSRKKQIIPDLTAYFNAN
ncbi:manganese-dependent inorganic pyrophosphatase [Candidatus Gracilibacteria bacterium]|nr:manganese-dependent inorganic pyrophosphatase [Candidatus Gracilibacteria bacterium]